MARLHQLPIEVRARICEFIGDIADVPSDYQPDPLLQQDDLFPTATGSTYSLIYKDLRSLALASKAFTDSAQRVLFRIAVVGGPRCIMRLLKSLLLYPKNRRYVRSLFVTRHTHPDALPGETLDQLKQFRRDGETLDRLKQFHRDGETLDQLKQFHRELRPLILTEKIDELYDASFFRGFEAGVSLGVCYNKDDWSTIATDFISGFMTKVADHVLRAIIQLCPFLSGFHICCNYCGSRSRSLEPETIPTVPASLDDGPSNTFPQLKSLTLNYDALLDQVDSIVARPRYHGGCPPNIERLTLIDFDRYHPSLVCLNFIHSWIRSNTSLKELRVINGFDDRLDAFFDDSITRERNQNWNTILPLFKDTLELLIFDGYFSMPWDGNQEDRFGPTRMLSCLGDFKKLAYLKVPLHMLRQDCPRLWVPEEGQQVLDFVQAKLPKGLKKVDIVAFEEDNNFMAEPWASIYKSIEPIETFQVRL